MVTLSGEEMSRFHRCAPAALARRGSGFVADTLARAFGLVVVGATPIVGMLWFDWSAAQLLVFLLAGAWIGIACDIARLWHAERAVRAFGQTHYDDWHVWLVTGALRKKTNQVLRAHLVSRWEPWMGVFVDLSAGGLATLIMVMLLIRGPGFGAEEGVVFDRKLLVSLGGVAACQVLFALVDIVSRRRGGGEARPLKASPGLRGLGLFLLVFVIAFAGDPDNPDGLAAGRVMLWVNGAVVALGVFNAVGLLWLRGETQWLRGYLRENSPRDPPRRNT